MSSPSARSGELESNRQVERPVEVEVEASVGLRRFASIWWAESSRMVPNMKKRYDVGIAPARTTPLRAPAVVAISSTIASRTFVKRRFRKGAALLHEQAITETMLAPMAIRISTWPNIVRIGTMKMPLAIPSMPPKALAATDTENSHSSVSVFICGNRLSAGLQNAVLVGSQIESDRPGSEAFRNRPVDARGTRTSVRSERSGCQCQC